MRRLLATTFTTLDGVMQAPGGPDEDGSSGFRYGGWSHPFWDSVADEVIGGIMGKPFDLLLGRRTYDIFAAFWPSSADEGAKPLNDATKYVASRSERSLDWGPSVLVRDAAAEVPGIKGQDGPELQVHGSSDLLQTLLRERLLDQLIVWTFPVLVGSGKRLFGDGTAPADLRLVASRVSTTGVVIATYEPAGDVKTGSFA